MHPYLTVVHKSILASNTICSMATSVHLNSPNIGEGCRRFLCTVCATWQPKTAFAALKEGSYDAANQGKESQRTHLVLITSRSASLQHAPY